MPQGNCWNSTDPLMVRYHDEEWGVPVHDDRKWFEFIVLDAFQAGLSWRTVLHKRENFRRALDDFDYVKIAGYDSAKVDDLLQDSGIIRNRLKIQSTITNASAFLKVRDEFGTFDAYIWGYTGGEVFQSNIQSINEMPVRTDLSDRISKDLIKRGFKFVGSTIVYAFLQAAGVVNDHLVGCNRYHQLGGPGDPG